MTQFATIVADPPWPYRQRDVSGSRQPKADGELDAGVSSIRRYGAMTISELAALRPPTTQNAHLYLWTTNAFMVEAHDVARAWGFEPKTIITWTKTRRDDPNKPSMKTGYYFRGATEHCVFCVRGSLRLQTARGVATAFLSPRLAHSVKPESFYELIEECSPGPYLELFARGRRDGWSAWGDEIESDAVFA